MATIKHISSKNANYSAAELYLTFEHDEFSNKPIRDAQGRLIPREDYRLETVLCGEENFAIACMRANLRYGKNNHKGDVKSHHYIQKIVDMDYAASKGACYVHWAKRHNLKVEAKTLLAYQQAGFQSPEELAAAISDAHESMMTARKKVKELEAVISKKKELQTHVQAFLKTAPTIAEYDKLQKKSKQDAFRQAHQLDFIFLVMS
mgnify:CR=1 FL=1